MRHKRNKFDDKNDSNIAVFSWVNIREKYIPRKEVDLAEDVIWFANLAAKDDIIMTELQRKTLWRSI